MSGTSLQGTAIWTEEATATAGGAEVTAADPARGAVAILGPEGVEFRDAATGALRFTLPKSDIPLELGGGNSVAISGDTLAVAYAGPLPATNGTIAFYTLAADGSGATLTSLAAVGVGPDCVAFTPDGGTLLVALEGEPSDDYLIDPKGGIAIIDTATGAVTTLTFDGFDTAALIAAGVRISGPDPEGTAATDLEPEYITVTPDGSKAYVTLQENNAIAEINLDAGAGPIGITRVMPLGFKDHSLPGQGLDPSDADGVTAVQSVPLFGVYMPDGIASFQVDGTTYLVTANEGDGREYGDYEDEVEIADVDLDPTAFPNAAELQADSALGSLNILADLGDIDGDGDYDQLFTLGGRSFTIWEVTDSGLELTFDSGDLIEQTLIAQFPGLLDDSRSDNKGPEPEHVTLGEVDGQLYAFVGLERTTDGSVMAFRIDSPTEASFAGLFTTEGDVAPEVFTFVPGEGENGPTLIVPNEASGTTTAYALETVEPTFTLQILHASDFEAGLEATTRAKNFAAIVDTLEDTYENSITLLSGDNFIPGVFTAAGTDPSVRDELAAFYEQLFDLPAGSLTGIRNAGALPLNALDIAIANAIGVQASVIGNHEFDGGPTAFAGSFDFTVSSTTPATPATTLARITNIGAQFPYLSANLNFAAESALSGLFTNELRDAASYATTADDLVEGGTAIQNEANSREIAPWTTINENGEIIGVLGITTQILASISSLGNVTVADPLGDGGVDNMDELAAILQPLINQMIDAGINKIILLAHLQQIANERLLATKLSGVDIIIGGGSNTIFADDTDVLDEGDTAGGGYPEVYTGADGGTVLLVNTDGNYNYVGRLVVEFDADGNILLDSLDPAVSGAYVTTDAGVDAVAGNGDGVLDADEQAAIFADGTRGGEVKQLTDAVQQVIVAKDGNVVGFTDVFLEGRRNFVRSEETNLGNLTADANLAFAKGADLATVISLKNGGGIRAEIGTIVGSPIPDELPPQANPEAGKPEGGISQLDIENSLRFNNTLSLLTLSAQGILNMIENGLRGANPGATPGAFPQVSGLKFSWDKDRASLDRVVDLAVVDQQGNIIDVIAENGSLVGDATREFRLVTLNFLAPGSADTVLGGGDSIIVKGATVSETGAGLVAGTLAVYSDFADLERVDLVGPGAGFELVGGEQSVLADYLAALHGTPETAYDEVDTDRDQDERIQNLDFRTGDVLPAPGEELSDGTNNLIVGSRLDETLRGGEGNDTIYGVDGDDFIRSGAGADLVLGGDGDDNIKTDGGSDTLVGGAGADRLTGGANADLFVFNVLDGAKDRITDFTVFEDRIGLSAATFGLDPVLDADLIAAGRLEFADNGQATTAATRFIFSNQSMKLYYDADGSGDGERVLLVKLASALDLTAADFVLLG